MLVMSLFIPLVLVAWNYPKWLPLLKIEISLFEYFCSICSQHKFNLTWHGLINVYSRCLR